MTARIHKIVVACGTAIATSTHVALKLQEELEKRGKKIRTTQCRVSEIPVMVDGASAVVATAQVPFDLDVAVFNGLGFLTGIGVEEVIEAIDQELTRIEQDETT